MEKGRWILAAALVVCVATGQVFAQNATTSEVVDVLEKSGAPAEAIAAIKAMPDAVVKAPVVASVINQINALGSSGASKDVILAATSVLTGQSAAAATMYAGSATASAVGGAGGTISQRLASVHREMNRSINNVGSFDAMASAAANRSTVNRIWFSPFYVYQDSDREFAQYTYNAVGGSIGYDRLFGPVVLGASFTYSRGDYNQKHLKDDNTIDNYGVTLYADYYTGSGVTFNFNAGYNYGDNDLKAMPTNTWLESSNHTNTWWVGGNVGYEFNVTECLKLTPTVGLFWSEARGSAFRNDALRQNLGRITEKNMLLPIDLNLEYTRYLSDSSSVSFRVGGGYAYNFKNDGARGTMYWDGSVAPIAIQGAKPGRDNWNLNAGVKYRFNKFDIGVDYRYDGKSNFQQHRVSGTFGINF